MAASTTAGSMSGALNVLIVDDSTVNCKLMSAMMGKMGHLVYVAENGLVALGLCEQQMPDLVLMDVQMPVMGGFEAVREMRRRYDAWFPILFLSAQIGNDEVVEGLRVGADDYLFKPVNYEILKAKIRQFQIRLEQNKRLLEYRARIEEETVTARAFIEQFTALDKISDPQVRFLLKPAESYSGDLIAVARSPDNRLHVLLADSAGHGLTAALAVIPITQPFYQMTAKGFDMVSILTELNARVRDYLPLPRFVAAAILSITPDTGVIEVWNGGLPPVLLLSEDGAEVVHRFSSRHLPLGVLRADEFDVGLEYHSLAGEGGHLLLCSDGATEISIGDNQMLGQQALVPQTPCASSAAVFDSVVGVIEAHLANAPPADDIALIVVDCQLPVAVAPRRSGLTLAQMETEAKGCAGSNAVVTLWQFSLTLTAQQLKNLEVVPFLLGVVRQIENDKIDSPLFLVLSELFNNALDHGVLKLNSAVKDQPDGMEHYYAERTRRLAELASGEIELRFEKLGCGTCGCLKIYVRDSGRGFDYSSRLSTDIADNQRHHGRGIALLDNVCERLQYLGDGSEVIAYLNASAGMTV